MFDGDDLIHWSVCGVLGIAAGLALTWRLPFWASAIVAILLVLWLLAILVSAAVRSAASDDPNRRVCCVLGLPNRLPAIPLPFAFLTIAVLSFAHMYQQTAIASEEGKNKIDTGNESVAHDDNFSFVYFSVVTITTVGYGDLHPVGVKMRILAILEIATGLLIIACSFPLVLARISSWKEPPRVAVQGELEKRIEKLEELHRYAALEQRIKSLEDRT